MAKLSPIGLIACAFLFGATLAQADTVYTYIGNDFTTIFDETPPAGTYTTSMSVTGSFALAAPLPANSLFSDISAQVLSFSFSDGRNTLTNNNASIVDFFAGTLSGNIVNWDIVLETPTSLGTQVGDQQFIIETTLNLPIDRAFIRECVSSGCDAGSGAFVNNDIGEVRGNPGSWSATPLPAALPLFATGIGALGLLGWRRKRKAQAVA